MTEEKKDKYITKYMRKYRKKARFLVSLVELVKKQLPAEILAIRKKAFDEIDAQYQKAYDKLIEDGRAVVHGDQPFDAEELIIKSAKRLALLKALQKYDKEKFDEQINKKIVATVIDLCETATIASPLYKAIYGTKDDENAYLNDLRISFVDRPAVPPLVPGLENELEKRRSKISSADEMLRKKLEKWPGSWRGSGGGVTVKDEYAGMSDSEIREAKKKERLEKSRKHMDKLMKEAKKVPDSPETRPDLMAKVRFEIIQKLLDTQGCSYTQAKKYAEDFLKEKRRKEPDFLAKIGMKSSEELFDEMLKKKRKHWLDKKDEEQSYVV